MSDAELPPIDPSEPPAPQKRRSPTWVRVVLFASLALNLLIVGLVVGTLGQRAKIDRSDAPRLRDAGLGPLAMILPRDQQGALREQLRHHAPDLRQNREMMRNDIRLILTALRSEPFDPGALAEVLSGQRRTATGRMEIGHRALIEAVSNATPQERARMADRLEKALQRNRSRTGAQKDR